MGFIVILHVIVSILLVISILMQAGRGGGLAESFASAESMFGTQTNAFMVRLSTILAVVFFSTSLILAMNSSKMDKSLMSKAKLPVQAAAAPAETSSNEPVVVVGEPQPMNTPVTTNTAK